MIFIKKIIMKKIVRLTESELINVVKKIINETKQVITEEVDFYGMKIKPSNDGRGHLILTLGKTQMDYKVNVDVKKLGFSVYKGPISVVALWKNNEGKFWAKDNTGKMFKLDSTQLKSMYDAIKSKSKQINFSGEGEVAGVSGTYDATLTSA
jgi:hypothetical protein